MLQIALPEHLPWWAMFQVRTEQVVEVVRVLHDMYSRPKAEYIHVSKDPQRKVKQLTPEITNADNSPLLPDSSNIAAIPGLASEMGAVDKGSNGQQAGAGGQELREQGQQGVQGGDRRDAEATSTAHQVGTVIELCLARALLPLLLSGGSRCLPYWDTHIHVTVTLVTTVIKRNRHSTI